MLERLSRLLNWKFLFVGCLVFAKGCFATAEDCNDFTFLGTDCSIHLWLASLEKCFLSICKIPASCNYGFKASIAYSHL